MHETIDHLKTTPQFTLLYDGECPFCKREISWMSKHNRKGQLAFEDITAPDFNASQYGLTPEAVMGVIHGVCDDGRVLKKVDVFIKAYRLLGLGWLVAPLSWPLLHSLANIGYEIFARYRVPLGHLLGRTKCETTHCQKKPQ